MEPDFKIIPKTISELQTLTRLKSNNKGYTLVLGSGIYRLINKSSFPLNSWAELLKAVAYKNGLCVEYELIDKNPTLAWEALLLQYQRFLNINGNKEIHSQDAEDRLKEDVCSILKIYKKNKTNVDFIKEKIYKLKIPPIESFIDLNFLSIFNYLSDEDLISNKSCALETKNRNQLQLYDFINLNGNVKVFQPNGTIYNKKSIRLGFRDFALQADSINHAFGHYKSEKVETLKDTWVRELMENNLIFIGVGLTSEEIGLRWAMLQKRRNYAKDINNTNRPINYMIMNGEELSQKQKILEQSKWDVLGIDILWVDSWESFWEL